MDALDLLRSLYVYQIWANGELLEKLAGLDQQEHVDQRHTATRLINHNLVVSKIFAAHLSGTRHGYASDNTVDTPALDELSADVAAMDRWYLDYIGAVSPSSCQSLCFHLHRRRQGDDVTPGNADPCRHAWRLSPRRDRADPDADRHCAAGIRLPSTSTKPSLRAGCRCASGLAFRACTSWLPRDRGFPGGGFPYLSFPISVGHLLRRSWRSPFSSGRRPTHNRLSFKCCLSWLSSNHFRYTSKKLVFSLVLFLQPWG